MAESMRPQARQSSRLCFSLGNFTGKVSHHEGDVPRLRRLYKAVRETREQLAGCMDPNVGRCYYRGLVGAWWTATVYIITDVYAVGCKL